MGLGAMEKQDDLGAHPLARCRGVHDAVACWGTRQVQAMWEEQSA